MAETAALQVGGFSAAHIITLGEVKEHRQLCWVAGVGVGGLIAMFEVNVGVWCHHVRQPAQHT